MVNSVPNVEHMAALLRTGTSSQRTVILFEMPQLISNSLPLVLTIIVPAICSSVSKWPEELQIAAAEALLDVSKEHNTEETTELIAQAALDVIRTASMSGDLHESWGEILVRVLPHTSLESNGMIDKIMQLLKTCVVDEHKVRRKLAARLFGAVSPYLSTDQVEEHILQHALKLADDRDIDVRGMIAESMAFVGAATSSEVTAKRVWPTLWGLLQDSDTRIRAVTLRAISNILDTHRKKGLNVDNLSKLLYPIFLKEATMAREMTQTDLCNIDDIAFVMLLILSQVFGQFAFSCAPHFTDYAEKDSIFKTFRCMAICNSAGIRRYCAYNLPGVSLIFAERQHYQLARILEHLCLKGSPETRCILAAGIFDSVTAIAKSGKGSSTIESLFHAVMQLLQDKNPLVQISMSRYIFTLLPSIGASLYPHSRDSRKQRCDTVFRILSTNFATNWRAQELLARQLQTEVPLASANALQTYILPLLYQLAEESPYLVRKSAMIALAKAFRSLPHMSMRRDTMRKFRIEWAEGGVYWMRMAYIECAEAAMSSYSSKLMKELFFDTLLFLADDPVANVRLRLTKMLPELAKFCSGSTGLKKAIETLKMDQDVDVLEAMAGIDERMVAVESDLSKFEDEDMMREQEESNIESEAIDNQPASLTKLISISKLRIPLSRLELTFGNGDADAKSSHVQRNSGTGKSNIDTIESENDGKRDEKSSETQRSPSSRRGLPKLNLSISSDLGNSLGLKPLMSPKTKKRSEAKSIATPVRQNEASASGSRSMKGSGSDFNIGNRTTRRPSNINRDMKKGLNENTTKDLGLNANHKVSKSPRLSTIKKMIEGLSIGDIPNELSKQKGNRPLSSSSDGLHNSVNAITVSPINSPASQNDESPRPLRLLTSKQELSQGNPNVSPSKKDDNEENSNAQLSVPKKKNRERLSLSPLANESTSPIDSPRSEDESLESPQALLPRRRSLQSMWREFGKNKTR